MPDWLEPDWKNGILWVTGANGERTKYIKGDLVELPKHAHIDLGLFDMVRLDEETLRSLPEKIIVCRVMRWEQVGVLPVAMTTEGDKVCFEYTRQPPG